MNAAPAALGIDVGTTNVKVALVGLDGGIAASAHRSIAAEQRGDVAEQDAERLWGAVVDAATEATAAAPDVARRVVAVGCCAQYSSIVPVDAAGSPVAPMLLWGDKRGSDRSWDLLAAREDAFDLWIERHGIPPVGGGLSLAHLLHLQHDRPDVHDATATWLEPVDWIGSRLTGRMVANQGTMFMSQLVDNREVGTTAYDPVLLEASGIDADRLPDLAPMDADIGTVLPDVADRMGIPADAVVGAGMVDTAADVLATGAGRPGVGGLSIGTTSVLVDTVPDKGIDVDHEILTMPSPFDGGYLLWAENGLGGRALEHVLTHFVHATDALGAHHTDDEFAALDAALSSVPAGAGGVLFLPWLNGSMSPRADARARGGFVNLSLETRRVDLVRAAAEGVARNLAWLLPHAEAFTGKSMDEIVFMGGAARSDVWAQILADVLDRPVSPLAQPEQALARSVALAALARQGHLDLAALDDLVETRATHEPDPATRGVHAALQAQHEAAFDALLPIAHSLSGGPLDG